MKNIPIYNFQQLTVTEPNQPTKILHYDHWLIETAIKMILKEDNTVVDLFGEISIKYDGRLAIVIGFLEGHWFCGTKHMWNKTKLNIESPSGVLLANKSLIKQLMVNSINYQQMIDAYPHLKEPLDHVIETINQDHWKKLNLSVVAMGDFMHPPPTGFKATREYITPNFVKYSNVRISIMLHSGLPDSINSLCQHMYRGHIKQVNTHKSLVKNPFISDHFCDIFGQVDKILTVDGMSENLPFIRKHLNLLCQHSGNLGHLKDRARTTFKRQTTIESKIQELEIAELFYRLLLQNVDIPKFYQTALNHFHNTVPQHQTLFAVDENYRPCIKYEEGFVWKSKHHLIKFVDRQMFSRANQMLHLEKQATFC